MTCRSTRHGHQGVEVLCCWLLGGLVNVPQPLVKAANETEGVRVQRRRSVSNTCKKQEISATEAVLHIPLGFIPSSLPLPPQPTLTVRSDRTAGSNPELSDVNTCIGLTPPPPSPPLLFCTLMGLDRRRSGPEAIAVCLETPWITVSTGRYVHHRGDLGTEGEGANTRGRRRRR